MKKDGGRRMVKEKEVADGKKTSMHCGCPCSAADGENPALPIPTNHYTTHTPPNLYCQQPILQETDKSLRNRRGKLYKPVLIKMRDWFLMTADRNLWLDIT